MKYSIRTPLAVSLVALLAACSQPDDSATPHNELSGAAVEAARLCRQCGRP